IELDELLERDGQIGGIHREVSSGKGSDGASMRSRRREGRLPSSFGTYSPAGQQGSIVRSDESCRYTGGGA
ncbi:hypothetical protein LLG90_28260, partial [Aromatoleum toluclasticum]|uniref:hypothetical protein n=1 Tax=Aromatoleum toluclasticum TaxID=92003 RepID=UPI001D186683